MATNIRIYKKRPGEPRDVGISTSSSGPGAGSKGHTTIHLDVREEDGLKVRLNLAPEDARRLAASLLDGAAFAEDAPCKCGHGRIAHSGRLAAGWIANGCAQRGCECMKWEAP